MVVVVVLRDGDDFARHREMMTGDANAAALGAFDAGATEVIVNDSHWGLSEHLAGAAGPPRDLHQGLP
jgi:D-amino peptidase